MKLHIHAAWAAEPLFGRKPAPNLPRRHSRNQLMRTPLLQVCCDPEKYRSRSRELLGMRHRGALRTVKRERAHQVSASEVLWNPFLWSDYSPSGFCSLSSLSLFSLSLALSLLSLPVCLRLLDLAVEELQALLASFEAYIQSQVPQP
jgi:hypothetical protein